MPKIIRSAAERGDAHTGWQSGDPSPKLNRRVRRVFPTAEIPHKWAHATQDEARNPQGNLFFRGATIYSYYESWPLAHIYTRRDGSKLVLTNCDRYSVTTSNHQYAVNRAVSHLDRIAVPNVILNMESVPGTRAEVRSEVMRAHEGNLAYLQRVAADALKTAQRAMSTRVVEWRRKEAFDALTNAGRYLGFFGIRRKAPQIPTAEWLAAEQRAQRIENPDPASADKRERASARRRELKAQREAQAIDCARTNWRLFNAFGSIPLSTIHRWRSASRSGPVMLRVNGDQIETSLGARVPLAVAPAIWELIYKTRSAKTPFVADGTAFRRMRIGAYPLDRIDADGTLHAGCHVIPYSELEALARSLGLAS